jgi:hypothetical protein
VCVGERARERHTKAPREYYWAVMAAGTVTASTRAGATGSGIHLAAAQQLAVRRVGEEAVVRRRMHRPAPAAQGFRPSLEGGCGRGGLNYLRKRLLCAVLRRACGSLVYIVGPEPEGDVAAQLHVVDAHLARARAHARTGRYQHTHAHLARRCHVA